MKNDVVHSGANEKRIKWLSRKDVDEIGKLNALVNEKVKGFVADASAKGVPLSPEVEAVLSGEHVVYKKRFQFIPPLLVAVALILIGVNFQKPMTILIAAVLMFFWYDFFSGMLHIVLDNPDFIHLPVLGPPCLEFQWHHHIPLDLTSKSFLEVCGDLNVVMLILMGLYVLIGYNSSTPMAITLVGFKILMAYYGQLCHCMSHTPRNHRPPWVISFQDAGLMISPKEHNIHHKTYNDNFCIGSGVCNVPLKWCINNVSSNKWFWLFTFMVSLVADVPLINYLLTAFAGFT